jgi:hypothetical protein
MDQTATYHPIFERNCPLGTTTIIYPISVWNTRADLPRATAGTKHAATGAAQEISDGIISNTIIEDNVNRIASIISKHFSGAEATGEDMDIFDDERVDKELRRWQDAIRDKMIDMGVPDSLIDGAGCDSGDPLDFTLAEVGQGVGYFLDQLEAVPRATREK